jgi:hypothetical protein
LGLNLLVVRKPATLLDLSGNITMAGGAVKVWAID